MSPQLHTPTSFDAHISDLIMAFAIPSIIFIVSLLGAFAWTAWNPVSRPHLNRVSFRLLAYALVANLAYAAGMISGTKLKAGAACNGSTFFYNSCLMFAGVMFFSMALNLQLVLVHGVNGQQMEKYYILGAVLLTLACNVPPYAAGALGFWEFNETCWYNSPDPAAQLRWFVGTQAFWMFLMAACEAISFFSVVGFMIFRHRVRSVISESTMSTLSQPPLPKPPIVLYRKMILRIGLYPLFSCFFNITGAVLDLHTVLDPTWTEVNWRLGVVALLIYVLRPFMYATLAATDPSFLRALRALHPPSEPQDHSTDPTRVHVALGCDIANTSSSGGTTSVDTEPASGPHAKGEKTTIWSDESVPEFTCQI
ncbi:hypothetical protein DFH08DRAFT_1074907 [Mycena albidolilacea]|uniref:G-protein coupled receptors family 2 profile 2 domain-containing protein n=1 Tax=Mycena albidolilacea TaxID=1033008 RepID=A0AAD7EZ55_9AGAR|nr:hypothetical protein DFH08DRAFT_1074907 [Mycena albidolilacea]